MIHPHGYWSEVSEANTHACDTKLCDAIIKTFEVETAIYIGCGDGAYTKRLNGAFISCIGVDGNPMTSKLSDGFCNVMDVSVPQMIGRYDLVLSLEVGEHIPKKFEQIFIDNLCRASKKWICLSWGVVGQPGYGHVNCQNNEYVINEMQKRGFKYDKKKSDYLRKNCNFEWFKHTIMVFYDTSDK